MCDRYDIGVSSILKVIRRDRCDEGLKAKVEGSTRLTYTGLRGDLEHLNLKTRLIDERFTIVRGKCVIVTI